MNRTHRIAIGAVAATLAVATPLAVAAIPATAGSNKTSPTPTSTHTLPSSATYTYSITATGLPGSTKSLAVNGTIAADLTTHAISLTADLPTAIGPIGPGTVDVLVVGGTLYVSAPGLSALAGGKPWISITEPAAMKTAHAFGQHASLQSVVGDVPAVIAAVTTKPAGHPLATVETTSTKGAITTTTLVLHLPQLHRHAPAPAGASTLPTTVPVTVSANAQGWLTSVSTSVTVGSATVSGSLTSTGYNTPVSIVAPPASAVMPIPSSALSMIRGLLTAGSSSSPFHGADLSVGHWLHHEAGHLRGSASKVLALLG